MTRNLKLSCNVIAALILMVLSGILARPPTHQEKPPSTQEVINGTNEWDLGVDYNRYLQEVVSVLESDPAFRSVLEKSDVEKIRDGSIAHELDMVNHNLRTKLDDVKRKEMERLRQLAVKQFEMQQGIDHSKLKMPNHLDLTDAKFQVNDLKKLIKATTNDLEEADRKRREEFKRYEMEKRFEEEQKLKHINNDDERKKEEDHIKEMKTKHKKHEKLHHPGSKDQLEEVWEQQDHMSPEDFDPKTFFAMHDLNGDRHWTEDEIKALFQKGLDKAYDPNASEDDMVERQEEAERMREHIFKEMDKNKDRMISEDEFLSMTKEPGFEQDEGWDTLDDIGDEFSEEEFHNFEMQRQREIEDMMSRGLVPPGYPYQDAPHIGNYPPHIQPGQGVPGSIPGQPAFIPQPSGGQHPGQPAAPVNPNGPNPGSIPGQPAYRPPPPQAGGQRVPNQQHIPNQANQFQAPQQQQQQQFQQQQFQQPPQQQQQQFQQPPQQQQFQQPPQQQQQFQQPPQQQQQFQQPPQPNQQQQFQQPPQPNQQQQFQQRNP